MQKECVVLRCILYKGLTQCNERMSQTPLTLLTSSFPLIFFLLSRFPTNTYLVPSIVLGIVNVTIATSLVFQLGHLLSGYEVINYWRAQIPHCNFFFLHCIF